MQTSLAFSELEKATKLFSDLVTDNSQSSNYTFVFVTNVFLLIYSEKAILKQIITYNYVFYLIN